MPTDPSNPGARQSTISPIQSNNDNNGPPPPTRKRRTDLNKYRGQGNSNDTSRQQIEEDGDIEILQISPESVDSNSAQRLQNLASRYKSRYETVENEKGELIKNVYELQIKYEELQKNYKELQGRMDSEKRRLQQRANESDLESQNLKKQLMELKEEASRYQSALGKATNVRWGDDDSNNPVQLTKSIVEIANSIAEITTVKGKDVTIIDNTANELLQKYNCLTRVNSGKSWKSILAAALQRLIIETLFQALSNYLSQSQSVIAAARENIQSLPKRSSSLIVSTNSNSILRNPSSPVDHNNNLEVEISLTMTSLVGLVNHLAETRKGSDDITKITPIKIRQQIYAVLGTRGFCKDNHPFIEQLTTTILDTLSRYRQMNKEKLAVLKENTTKLVTEFVHLYFRLNAQEPIPDFKDFFDAGTPVQNNLMEGAWDDDASDDLEVEICSFPLISVKSTKDNSRKVLSKAHVVPRKSGKK
ncbi:16523_t:CDS:2 [Rhizophagus irregularis]|nr:16523_t:CDS:2 [Rhizophagus irregularis]